MKNNSRVFEKQRKRRIIYNDDCGQLYNQTATDACHANDPNASFIVHFWTTGGDANTQVYMRLNHKLLQPIMDEDSSDSERHYVAKADAGLTRVGFNELSIWCNADIRQTPNPVIVHEVLVEAKY